MIYEKNAKKKHRITVGKTEVVNKFRSSGGSFFSGEMYNVFIIIYAALLGLFLARENFRFGQAVIRAESPLPILHTIGGLQFIHGLASGFLNKFQTSFFFYFANPAGVGQQSASSHRDCSQHFPVLTPGEVAGRAGGGRVAGRLACSRTERSKLLYG